ncbi:preprotein translocase subunit SecG [Gramella sp. GC03-9]|uniref:Protein-export membrane protein SecG n=1 Tax=Christiangramia oceanisediminis TaxID=2920386 RepID=A0A9X2I309_9FLAO|nr:preprotein translocase subunit SecG [Gramella oceanisediminis]MCP9198910.1 preprotein translocase subunit SecG [Gramella oceanisediminis]
MSTFTIFLALIIIVAFLLVVVIMVQNPKGGGLSSSFGGGGQQMGGVKKTTDFLDKSTWTLATLLLVLILLSNVTIMDAPSAGTRVFESDEPVNTEVPATQTPAQQPVDTDSAQ